ncbi:MAG: putative 7-carboxy-7-deazaguanine synthase QueE [Prevotella sp.]|nr:putative 7-carboxy-7-deazaguanine synthase QueE [Prevotella sp.]
MSTYSVAEKFVSINGEGRRAGQTAVFVRFKRCNLSCSYCDTAWANAGNCPCERLTEAEILGYVLSSGIKNVTLTGGEPLLQPNIKSLIDLLGENSLSVEIETNGSVDISGYGGDPFRPIFTLDYKLPSSGMESHMLTENYKHLQKTDTVKFVAGSPADLERALEIIREYGLTEKCAVFISPVFGKIDPAEIVEFMIKNKLNGVNLQLQLHKFIWEPNARGV